jgi:hypothetical protein
MPSEVLYPWTAKIIHHYVHFTGATRQIFVV